MGTPGRSPGTRCRGHIRPTPPLVRFRPHEFTCKVAARLSGSRFHLTVLEDGCTCVAIEAFEAAGVKTGGPRNRSARAQERGPSGSVPTRPRLSVFPQADPPSRLVATTREPSGDRATPCSWVPLASRGPRQFGEFRDQPPTPARIRWRRVSPPVGMDDQVHEGDLVRLQHHFRNLVPTYLS